MKELCFVTGNAKKLSEAKAILTSVMLTSQNFDVDETQSLDPHAVVEHKMQSIKDMGHTSFFVEDVSFVCEELGRLPGPFIKYFLQELGAEKVASLVLATAVSRAKASCHIGYVDAVGESHILTGEVTGDVVMPTMEGYGFDPIFKPDGFEQTWAQMGEEKNTCSHRYQVLRALRDLLGK